MFYVLLLDNIDHVRDAVVDMSAPCGNIEGEEIMLITANNGGKTNACGFELLAN